MITLYHCDAARSFRPLWMLEELGLPYELKMLPFPPRVFAKEFLGLNPLGTIPFMIDGETKMTESSGICHYLGTKYGPTPLIVGLDEPAYGAFLNWMYFSDATLTFPQTLVLRYSQLEPGGAAATRRSSGDYAKWFLGRLRAVEARDREVGIPLRRTGSPPPTSPTATRSGLPTISVSPRILGRMSRPIGRGLQQRDGLPAARSQRNKKPGRNRTLRQGRGPDSGGRQYRPKELIQSVGDRSPILRYGGPPQRPKEPREEEPPWTRSWTHNGEQSGHRMLITPERVFYAGLLGRPRERCPGAFHVYVAIRDALHLATSDGQRVRTANSR